MREKIWRGRYECLKIPVQHGEPATMMEIVCDSSNIYRKRVCLARTGINGWRLILLSVNQELAVRADIEEEQMKLIVPCFSAAVAYEEVCEGEQGVYHFCTSQKLGKLYSAREMNGTWRFTFSENNCDGERQLQAVSSSLLEWSAGESLERAETNLTPVHTDNIKGDVQSLYLYEDEGRKLIFGTATDCLMLPLEIQEGIRPAGNMKKLRAWVRCWENEKLNDCFQAALRFRIAPSNWPNIRILPAEGKTDDIWAEAHEIQIRIKVDKADRIKFQLCGINLIWDGKTYMLTAGAYQLACPPEENVIMIKAYIDQSCGEIFTGTGMLFLHKSFDKEAVFVDNVSGNLDKCKLETYQENKIIITAEKGKAVMEELKVYGLRKLKYECEELRQIQEMQPGRILYKDKHYCVYDNQVCDEFNGKPDAYVPDSNTIISLVRAVEEFQWRNTRWGDMVRVLSWEDIWHPGYGINEYPQLKTGIPVVDAAYNLALDTFCICKSRDYALPGQEKMWSAGAFQGKGQGFGVWMRDTAHVALRCGNLLDPETARRTLLYTTQNGFDNGCDGASMAIVGFWDYYLASDDIIAIYEAWPQLLKSIEQIDSQYHEECNLVYAPQSTSNDAFDEPESGGYCLGTEVYDMKAYEAMAYLGRKIRFDSGAVEYWAMRGAKIREQIGSLYWNGKFGYYTSGPQGSEAYEKGYWETSGQECVLWNKFAIASAGQREEILRKMDNAAMCEYGVVLFPYRKEHNHFCGSVWGVWEAGIAAAASEAGSEDILYKLLFQQIRNCVMNKTFYEVIDACSGEAWRWPAQLWNAAGFISVIYYGILGINYDEAGMRINPLLRKEWKGTVLRHFRYGQAELEIITEGYGRLSEMLLDGVKSDLIPKEIRGRHSIILKLDMEDCAKIDC